ncbi:MAG: phosphatidylserine decarboxylase family protein [Anaerolineales bacterium]|nr:MAG: phosphatidylserine decarboxylase family protein [Anaerolineales bacterium]
MHRLRAALCLPLARGAERELTMAGIPLILALVASLIWPGLHTFLPAGLLTTLFALLLYFFRDPERTSPAGEGVFLAPADGRVVEVKQVHEPRFLQGEGLKISIFMSLLDVHVNRVPVEGQVVLVEHVPGQFLQAFRPEASEVNEHNLVGLESRHGRVLVKQVAGIMARRVVCWVRPGQKVQAGDRLGVVKFGSRVDLYLPPGAASAVRVGDRARAGVTVIARWKGEVR